MCPEIPAFAAASGSQASLEASADTLTVDGIAFTYPDSTDGTFDEGVAQQGVGWSTTHELGNPYYASASTTKVTSTQP